MSKGNFQEAEKKILINYRLPMHEGHYYREIDRIDVSKLQVVRSSRVESQPSIEWLEIDQHLIIYAGNVIRGLVMKFLLGSKPERLNLSHLSRPS